LFKLETLGKLKDIQGYNVRMTLDKLPGIRSDLVRLDDDWQEWGFEQLIEALRKWTVRNPADNNTSMRYKEHNRRSDNSYSARSDNPILPWFSKFSLWKVLRITAWIQRSSTTVRPTRRRKRRKDLSSLKKSNLPN